MPLIKGLVADEFCLVVQSAREVAHNRGRRANAHARTVQFHLSASPCQSAGANDFDSLQSPRRLPTLAALMHGPGMVVFVVISHASEIGLVAQHSHMDLTCHC